MNKIYLIILFLAASIVYLLGLFVNVMDVDAAQYAAMSREMFENHSYLKVYNNGVDYLDKPPLIFWFSVLSFKIFGISTFSYKLPSFLCTLIGVYSTFRLTKVLYTENVAWVASLMLYTCQAFFLFNNDVRTDTLLTAFVIFSCWQLVLFCERKSFGNLVLGFIAVGFAMMAKGPIGAIVPASAIASHFILKRRWSDFFQWQWIAGILITLILLIPMCIGLYNQFGIEGPKFFFWTQSFGRITGENVWENNTGYFYFTHVFLWSFLPWPAIFLFAFATALFQLVKKKFSAEALNEGYTIGGFLLPVIALSFSHYKLPHYIFVVYPLISIFTAAFLFNNVKLKIVLQKFITSIQLLIIIAITGLILFILLKWFPANNILITIYVLFSLAATYFIMFSNKTGIEKMVLTSAFVVIISNAILNLHIYPSLLKYQSGSELAKDFNQLNSNSPVYYFGSYNSYAFGFYAKRIMRNMSMDKIVEMKNNGSEFWLLGDDEMLKELEEHQIKWKKEFSADDFHITTLTLPFLNPLTRSSATKKVYLVQL